MDRYSLNARVYPMLLFYAPFCILLIIVVWNIKEYWHYGIPTGIGGLLLYLTSHLGRDNGKKKEAVLWDEWGGAPTDQLFRWQNNIIDEHTKIRNHVKMNTLCPVTHNVDRNFEIQNPILTDSVYSSWNYYLRNQTRDISKYPLIFKENMNYGFRRNLWGLKPYAIFSITFLMIITYVFFVYSIGIWEFQFLPELFWLLQTILAAILLVWVFFVTKSWVHLPAFEYAKRLHESIDSL